MKKGTDGGLPVLSQVDKTGTSPSVSLSNYGMGGNKKQITNIIDILRGGDTFAKKSFFIAFHQICFANTVYSVDINDIDKKAVAEYLVRDLMNTDFNILSTNENQVAVRRDVNDFWGQAFFCSQFNTVSEVRAYFNLVQVGADTQVTAEYRIVTNPNSGFEHYTVGNKKRFKSI